MGGSKKPFLGGSKQEDKVALAILLKEVLEFLGGYSKYKSEDKCHMPSAFDVLARGAQPSYDLGKFLQKRMDKIESLEKSYFLS